MFFTQSYEENIQNMNVMCLGLKSTKWNEDWDRGYEIFLKKLPFFSEEFWSLKSDSTEPLFKDYAQLKKAAPDFYENHQHHFIKNPDGIQKQLDQKLFDKKLALMAQENEKMHFLFTHLLKLITIQKQVDYKNGTSFDTLGHACLNYKDIYGFEDFLELMFHQLVHTLVYIDDQVNPHMKEEHKTHMIQTDVKNLRGGTGFEAYIGFHSYMVGIEMLQFRRDRGVVNYENHVHGHTQRIHRRCQKFLNLMKNEGRLFTERAHHILDETQRILNETEEFAHA